ncbi:hypothetical protein KSP39_PZI022445 [Platanthera zijinensis]|uniref:Uncharacterized protein n=1 Tax=Platanthera zijinensis TaxID=2320716 RepID=A0AAP0FV11_9ASPA
MISKPKARVSQPLFISVPCALAASLQKCRTNCSILLSASAAKQQLLLLSFSPSNSHSCSFFFSLKVPAQLLSHKSIQSKARVKVKFVTLNETTRPGIIQRGWSMISEGCSICGGQVGRNRRKIRGVDSRLD